MSTTEKSTHERQTYNPPVAGIRIMQKTSIFWLSDLLEHTDRITIGRTRQNDIRIRHLTVSRHHCELTRHDDGGYVLIDRGSRNGVHVSTRGEYGRYHRVERVHLQVGMHIDIGKVTMIPVDQEGECPVTVKRYSELLRVAHAVYGGAAAAARHIGRRSQQVVLRAIQALEKKENA